MLGINFESLISRKKIIFLKKNNRFNYYFQMVFHHFTSQTINRICKQDFNKNIWCKPIYFKFEFRKEYISRAYLTICNLDENEIVEINL